VAAYARQGQTFTFYEIDPAVVRVASDPSLFTYLSDARGAVHVVVGDGRISLQHARNGTEDMVVLDAFNSDSIPVHLMTREAFQLYMTKLTRNGVLLVHVTNRYLDLAPVVGAIARDLGLHAVTRFHDVDSVRLRIGEQPSQWIALARNNARLGSLERRHWSPLGAYPGKRAWTDDFSNIVSAIKWTS
jgi:spermidine synthase